MTTTTKVIAGAGIIALIAIGMRKKKTTTTAETEIKVTDFIPELAIDKYEGKVVVADNGNWFVVKNGKKYFTGSVQAIIDFQAANPGSETPIQNVPLAELEKYPIAGTIQANNNYVGQAKLGAVDVRTLCQHNNPDGSRNYYSPMNGTDCNRGDIKVVKSFTGV